MKKKFQRFFKRIFTVINKQEMMLLPGQLAFFLVLAIIPTVTLISYGASVLNLSMDFLYDFLSKAFSTDIASVMLKIPDSATGGIGLIIVIVFCYYISSNGANSIIVTSNSIYGIENGGWWSRRLKAILMSFIFVLLIVSLLLIPIFGDKIIELIKWVNLNSKVTNIIVTTFNYLKSPIMWLFLYFLIKIIYILAPDRKIKSHNASYGAIFTTVSWIITTEVYSLYVNEIADYSAFYGNLANACVLMIWFYFLAYFFVIGMSLNSQRENEKIANNGSINDKKE